jgi:hypothetical protein
MTYINSLEIWDVFTLYGKCKDQEKDRKEWELYLVRKPMKELGGNTYYISFEQWKKDCITQHKAMNTTKQDMEDIIARTKEAEKRFKPQK